MEEDGRPSDSNLPEDGGADRPALGKQEGRPNSPREGNSRADITYFTTVCVDSSGRIFDLSFEHPSWEQTKRGRGKKFTGFGRPSAYHR